MRRAILRMQIWNPAVEFSLTLLRGSPFAEPPSGSESKFVHYWTRNNCNWLFLTCLQPFCLQYPNRSYGWTGHTKIVSYTIHVHHRWILVSGRARTRTTNWAYTWTTGKLSLRLFLHAAPFIVITIFILVLEVAPFHQPGAPLIAPNTILVQSTSPAAVREKISSTRNDHMHMVNFRVSEPLYWPRKVEDSMSVY